MAYVHKNHVPVSLSSLLLEEGSPLFQEHFQKFQAEGGQDAQERHDCLKFDVVALKAVPILQIHE